MFFFASNDAFSKRSSSIFVSLIIASSSEVFVSKSSCLIVNRSVASVKISFFPSILNFDSFAFFSFNLISNSWNSTSLAKDSNSRLFRTLFCCSLYFVIAVSESLDPCLRSEISVSISLISSLIFAILVVKPRTSSSKSWTSNGSSPRIVLIRSISVSICWSFNSISSLSLIVTSFSFFLVAVAAMF